MSSPSFGHPTHSLLMGYLCWLFGWAGAHRFYYGKPLTGTLMYLLGLAALLLVWASPIFILLFIPWFLDLFFIPGLNRKASRRYQAGRYNYSVAWILLTFFGLLGFHRFYLGKWISGLLYLFTGGIFGVGWLLDFWGLNWQISEMNREAKKS